MTTLSFLMWGVLVVYWKALDAYGVNALETLAHRFVWALVFTAGLLTLQGRWSELARSIDTRRDLARVAASALLLGVNWFTYVWAINHGRVLETSLGYFITPLVSVLLGCLVLKERLSRWQVVAIALAGAGVAIRLTVCLLHQGRLPWVAAVLAVTFSTYGLLRKTARVESLPGLVAETAVLSLPAIMFLVIVHGSGQGRLGNCPLPAAALLIGTGVITALPLLCFAYGARRVKLSTVGFLQYLAPSCTFLLGVFAYGEALTASHAVAFGLTWFALAIYSWESLRNRRRGQGAPPVLAPEG